MPEVKKLPLTPIGRVSFPSLDKPTAMKEGDEPKYSVTLLFDERAQHSKEYKAIVESVELAIKERWPKNPPKNLRTPFRDGGEKAELDGYEEDVVFVKLSGKYPPTVKDQVKNNIPPLSVYAGCYARASYTVYAYDRNGNRGVALGLGNVQFAKDGEPFGSSGSNADDDFNELDNELSELIS